MNPAAGDRAPGPEVNGWTVADLTRSAVVDRLGRWGAEGATRIAACLHVSALSTPAERNRDWSRHVDMAYADGWSVALIGRLAGGRDVERATLTHLAADVLGGIRARLDRAPRVALIGGPPGLAETAGRTLASAGAAEVVYACDGYAEDPEWPPRLARLRDASPDVTFVGLGYPLEVEWCVGHRDALPAGLVLTCGGFFGYLAGRERRAPPWVRRVGLEWAWRTVQAPGRLIPRYARGLGSLVVVGVRTLRERRRGRGPA